MSELQKQLSLESLKQLSINIKMESSVNKDLKESLDIMKSLGETFKKTSINFQKNLSAETFAQTINENTPRTSTSDLFETMGNVKGAGHTESLSAVKSFGKMAVGVFKSLGTALKSALGPLAFAFMFMEPFEPLLEIFGAFAEILGTALMPLLQPLIDWLVDCIPYVTAFAEWLGILTGWLGTAIEDGIKAFANWIKDLIPNLMEGLAGFPEKAKNFFSNIWENVTEWFSGLTTGIANWFINAWNGVGSWFSGMFEAIANFFSNAWNNIGDWFSGLFEWFRNLPRLILDAVINGFNAMGDWASEIGEGISDWWSDLWS